MNQIAEYPTEYMDESDTAFDPAYDFDFLDDPLGDDEGTSLLNESAWQKIERRKETAWLRDQMVDWGDWDIYD